MMLLSRKKKIALTALAGAGAVPALAVLFLNDPENVKMFPGCLLHLTTGLHCPGCGSTRALHALLHGDIGGAIDKNIVFVLAILPVSFGVGLLWLRWIDPENASRYRSRLPAFVPWTVMGLLLLYGVLRNLPFHPFSWLAP